MNQCQKQAHRLWNIMDVELFLKNLINSDSFQSKNIIRFTPRLPIITKQPNLAASTINFLSIKWKLKFKSSLPSLSK